MAARVATIFGGSGFVGRYLVQRLARRGWVIRIAVRHPDSASFLRPMGHVGQITPIAANLRDDRSVAAAVSGVDAVVNLVGILHESGRQTFKAVHVEGAQRVAMAAKAAGAERFIQMSALGADPNSPAAYARSKAAGEAAVRAAFPEASILRPSVIFGPEDDFFNRFAAMARLLPALPLIGGGKTKFQPVYVGDVAEAMARIIEDPAARGKLYELGGPQTYSFKELLELLLQEIGRRRILLPLPFSLASLQGAVLQHLPNPPLTRDQVELLKQDNVVSGTTPTLADLGIQPTAVEVILPTYLDRFRRGGRYDRPWGR
ncbi:complex I NDUFA9 subunit family protein [Rhodospirillaceae bacterium SYSU D60014]|uniref:complex I NDUFA9 subunit family protein n=1 Tax=Virgifigura deserti TaxID=2268457 RepID=UPI000E66AAB1